MMAVELIDIEEDNRKLGAQIKARRGELGMSLRDLATATGLSPTFISSLERGLANPTLDSLRKVANALNTPIFRLMDGVPERAPVVRRDQRLHITLPPGRISIEVLTPTLTGNMVLFQVRATAAEGNLVVQPLAEPTEECIVVLKGRIGITVAAQTHELQAGDSIYFEGHDLESIHVLGAGEASYISAITPPVF
jgi:transcriptional regulator with XRE-family HTH domain